MPGSLEIPLPTPNPGDGGMPECRALSWVGDGPSTYPLPSPFPGETSVAPPPAPTACWRPAGRTSTALQPRERQPGEGQRPAGSCLGVSAGLP